MSRFWDCATWTCIISQPQLASRMLPKTDAFAGAHVVTIKMRFAFQSILSPTLQVYLPDFVPGQPLQSDVSLHVDEDEASKASISFAVRASNVNVTGHFISSSSCVRVKVSTAPSSMRMSNFGKASSSSQLSTVLRLKR